MDAFTRPHEKRLGEWMGALLDKTNNASLSFNGKERIPIAHINFNLPSPTEAKPTLLHFSDVKNIFHEFGHALQHMLTK